MRHHLGRVVRTNLTDITQFALWNQPLSPLAPEGGSEHAIPVTMCAMIVSMVAAIPSCLIMIMPLYFTSRCSFDLCMDVRLIIVSFIPSCWNLSLGNLTNYFDRCEVIACSLAITHVQDEGSSVSVAWLKPFTYK